MDKYQLAKIAYEAWCRRLNWKPCFGASRPFDAMDEDQKEAWNNAVMAVSDYIALQTGKG